MSCINYVLTEYASLKWLFNAHGFFLVFLLNSFIYYYYYYYYILKVVVVVVEFITVIKNY